MDPQTLKNIIEELRRTLPGAMVRKITQPTERLILVNVYVFCRGDEEGREGQDEKEGGKGGKAATLLISADPRYPRMHLSTGKFKNPPRPPRFCALLRSRLQGAIIEEVSTVEGPSGLESQRIAELVLRKGRGRDKDEERFTLIAELIGKSANVILTRDDGTVVDALRRFPKGTTEKGGAIRVVAPGVKLAPLPPVQAGSLRPRKGETFEPAEGETWNRAAERHYLSLIKDAALKEDARAIRRALGTVGKKARRKLRNLLGDKERAEAALGSTKTGELLLTNFKRIEKGMGEIEVEDVFACPPLPLTITLDPKKVPKENVDAYFKRAKKAKTALKLLKVRIPEVERELEFIDGLRFDLERIQGAVEKKAEGSIKEAKGPDVDVTGVTEEVAALREELERAGYLKPGSSERAAKKGPRKEAASPYTKGKTTEGFVLLWGRNARGNDVMLREQAGSGDLWFHAKGVGGSHVLLKPKGSKKPTEKAIVEAARTAARNSRAKASLKVEVIYTDAKYVKKPKGAKAGTVLVGEYKSMVVKTV